MSPTLQTSRPVDLDSFAYVVAHDLKAPLRSLHLFASVLHEDLGDVLETEHQEHFDALLGELRRMADLVDGVRRFADACAVHGTTPDVRAAAEDAWRATGGPESGRPLRVDDLPPLPMPPLHTATVLRALLRNAILHGEGPVTVTAVDGTVEVRDEGPGLPKPLPELSQPFLPRLAPPEGAGPGIGLALCQHVLSHHGGRLEQVPSERGTVVRIVLST